MISLVGALDDDFGPRSDSMRRMEAERELTEGTI